MANPMAAKIDTIAVIFAHFGITNGTCTEIKESQLNCATADDLQEYAEKVENILQEGVIPAVNKVNELIKNPPTYNIEMKTDGLAENLKNGLSEAVKADLYESVDNTLLPLFLFWRRFISLMNASSSGS